MTRAIYLIIVLVALLLPPKVYAADARFAFEGEQALCKVDTQTAEGSTMHSIAEGLNADDVKIYGFWVECDAFERMTRGDATTFYPVTMLSAAKTNGVVMPFKALSMQMLQGQITSLLGNTDFDSENERVEVFLRDYWSRPNHQPNVANEYAPPKVVDVTNETISVARHDRLNVGDSTIVTSTVATTVIVKGYVVTITIVDTSLSEKDFWKMQAASEEMARSVSLIGT